MRLVFSVPGDAAGRGSLGMFGRLRIVPPTLEDILERYPCAVSLSRNQLFGLLRDAREGDPVDPGTASLPLERAVLDIHACCAPVAAKAKTESLRSGARISLAVDFPQEGTVSQFKKG